MNLKQHAVLTLAALLASVAAVWWIGTGSSGTVFITTMIIILFNAVGAIIARPRP